MRLHDVSVSCEGITWYLIEEEMVINSVWVEMVVVTGETQKVFPEKCDSGPGLRIAYWQVTLGSLHCISCGRTGIYLGSALAICFLSPPHFCCSQIFWFFIWLHSFPSLIKESWINTGLKELCSTLQYVCPVKACFTELFKC